MPQSVPGWLAPYLEILLYGLAVVLGAGLLYAIYQAGRSDGDRKRARALGIETGTITPGDGETPPQAGMMRNLLNTRNRLTFVLAFLLYVQIYYLIYKGGNLYGYASVISALGVYVYGSKRGSKERDEAEARIAQAKRIEGDTGGFGGSFEGGVGELDAELEAEPEYVP